MPAIQRDRRRRRRRCSSARRRSARRMGLKPRARIRATAKIGTDPTIMLTGPVPVTEKILAGAGMSDLRHRPLRGERGLRLGRAALHAGLRRRSRKAQRQRRRHRHGPSLGATGAIIIGTLLDEMERADRRPVLPRSASLRAWARHDHERVDRPCPTRCHTLAIQRAIRFADRRPRRGPADMTEFTMTTDADGVATIVWDTPGKSMNVMSTGGHLRGRT